MAADCEKCRQFFADCDELSKKLAGDLDTAYPDFQCEECSVGRASPGLVANGEQLLRLLISPRDFDGEKIASQPFKKAFESGLSVIRDIATDDQIAQILEDNLWRKAGQEPKTLDSVLTAQASAIREISFEDGRRALGVYDQTVSRRDTSLAPVPTHAGVFGRVLKNNRERQRLEKDVVLLLHKHFTNSRSAAVDFRDGAFLDLSERSKKGEFVIPEPAAAG